MDEQISRRIELLVLEFGGKRNPRSKNPDWQKVLKENDLSIPEYDAWCRSQSSRKPYLPTPSESSRRSSVAATHNPHFKDLQNDVYHEDSEPIFDPNSTKRHSHQSVHSHKDILSSIEEEDDSSNTPLPLLQAPANGLDISATLHQVDQAMNAQGLDDLEFLFTLAYEGLSHKHLSGRIFEEDISCLPSSTLLSIKERKCRLLDLVSETIEANEQKAREEKTRRKMEKKKKAERKIRKVYVTRLGREKEARALEQQAIAWYGSSVLENRRRCR